jgi:hypothetical protein
MPAGWGRFTHKISNPIFTTEDTELSEKIPKSFSSVSPVSSVVKTVRCSACFAQALLFAEAGADLRLDTLSIQSGLGQQHIPFAVVDEVVR